MKKVINIIVAAGSGSRFGSSLPKQFCRLADKTVLEHAVGRIEAALPQSQTVVVVSADYRDLAPDRRIVIGGKTRWESVKNAIEATKADEADVIIVHDGARPLPQAEMIRCVVDACESHQGAIPVVEVTDSLCTTYGSPVKRSDFRAVQTPQAFRAKLLRQAYELPYSERFTDDASVMAAAGFTDVALVEGNPENIKITRPADIKIAEIYLNELSGKS